MPTKQSLIHSWLAALKADAVAFEHVASSIAKNITFTGDLAPLETIRDDLVSAFNLIASVGELIGQIQKLVPA